MAQHAQHTDLGRPPMRGGDLLTGGSVELLYSLRVQVLYAEFRRIPCLVLDKVPLSYYLVAYAFHGSPPTEKHEVNHKNGDTRDNRASNLEWVTRSANNLHSYRELGRQAVVPAGEDQWNSKLTNVDVVAIRKLWDGGGITQREIGERYDVLQTTISRIVMRQSWKHI